jgi:Ran GTPase-activating protein (RanGAP) involved in mRNA processing and transport
MSKTLRKNKILRKNNSLRKNRKSKKNVKHYLRKNKSMKVNKMRGGTIWNNMCGICRTTFIWPEEGEWVEKFGPKPDNFNNVTNPGTEKLEIGNISELLCGHTVHTKCIKSVYQKKIFINCPNCKQKMKATSENILPLEIKMHYDKNYYIRKYTNLTELNLQDLLYSNKIFKSICEALRVNKKIIKLNINNINIGDGSGKAFVDALKDLSDELKVNDTLTQFTMSNNIGNVGAAALAEALKRNQTLRTLDISKNGIGSAGAAALADALKMNTTLTTLDISSNYEIGDAGAAALAEALTHNTSLTELWISNNNIGLEGATALSEALKYNTGLKTLFINFNNIGDAGAEALAEALTRNTSLKTLNINNNNIGDAGAIALAEGLKDNKGLKSLYINNNNIGDIGATSLADALTHNKSLTELSISYNKIGSVGATALAEALKINATLLFLYNTFNDSSIIETIGKLLIKNRSLLEYEVVNDTNSKRNIPTNIANISNEKKREVMSQLGSKSLSSKFMGLFGYK